MKLKQLDRFETIVRDAADRQRKWREQLIKNKAINEDLQVSTACNFIYPFYSSLDPSSKPQRRCQVWVYL